MPIHPPLRPEQKTCGRWPSTVSAAMVAEGACRIVGVAADLGDLVVAESRPLEKGRITLLAIDGFAGPKEILPAPFSARSRVHEYGGGAFTISRQVVYFVNDADQQVYRVDTPPVRLTNEPDTRFADLVVDIKHQRILCIAERHGAGAEPENFLCAVPLAGGPAVPLARGADFYSSPRVDKDGTRLAYVCWRHPNMPWDGTELHLCALDDTGAVASDRVVAGGGDESVSQPKFAWTGELYFMSDRDGVGQLYRLENDGAVSTMTDAKTDLTRPAWSFATSTYGFTGEGEIITSFLDPDDGRQRFGMLFPSRDRPMFVRRPHTMTDVACIVDNGHRASYFLGGAPHLPSALYVDEPRTPVLFHQYGPKQAPLPIDDIAHVGYITFPTGGGMEAHGYLYGPKNSQHRPADRERPPLVVICHGGPTGQTSTAFSLAVHFWTTRGFAVLDVVYRGSTGLGRAYRKALDGAWGVADVEDCVAGVRYLVEETGDVDPDRVVIRGSSAGGLTVLMALAKHRVFRAGASYYGVCDLASLATDTHKFESRYLDRLVGPYPERADLYRDRSPLTHADAIQAPVIFFHGAKDPVVPIDQAERMQAALQARSIPSPMHVFPEESHGFRQADTIAAALEAELAFYLGVFDGTIRSPDFA